MALSIDPPENIPLGAAASAACEAGGSFFPPRQRYKLTIAYDGTLFHGWQRQEPPGLPPLRTVAGELTIALRRLLQQPVEVVGASRTDAGVHARGQVAHFDAEAVRIPLDRMTHAINSRLPEDMEVVSAQPVPSTFNAIDDARVKQYRYRIFNTERRPLNVRHAVYHCWTPLALEPMREAGRRLIGTHDFAAFAAAGHNRVSTVRTIFDCRVEVSEPEVHILVEGGGFLYNMVRIIAGTLLDVGRGRFGPDVIDKMLATRNRNDGGPTLPPSGLCLEWIKYDE